MKHAVVVPESSEKMRPTLHLDMEEIEGMGDAEVGDSFEIHLKAKLISMSLNERMTKGGKETHHSLSFEIAHAKKMDRVMPEKKTPEGA